MRVKLIDPTSETARLVVPKVWVACRTCYSEKSPLELWEEAVSGRVSEEKMLRLIRQVLDSGHHSTIEHVTFTFLIEGVSRVLTHQLVRHRVGIAFDQQSQRYVRYREPAFVTPPSVERSSGAMAAAEAAVKDSRGTYEQLLDAGIPAEDARFYFVNAAASNLQLSVNLRQLIHMCHLRLCTMAQWEIRRLHALMRAEVVKLLPFLKGYLQPKCVPLGYCDEAGNRDEHCKVRPHRDTLFRVYEMWRQGLLVPRSNSYT